MLNKDAKIKRYIINTHPKVLEVHDRRNQGSYCHIKDIIKSDNIKYLDCISKKELSKWFLKNPDYHGCIHCLPDFAEKNKKILP